METYEEGRVGGIIENLYQLVHKGFKVSAMSGPVTEILSGLAIVTVIVYGGYPGHQWRTYGRRAVLLHHRLPAGL